jgi:hypothetical protein
MKSAGCEAKASFKEPQMDDLDLSKPYEEIRTLDQHHEGSTHGFVTSNPKMLRIMDTASVSLKRMFTS